AKGCVCQRDRTVLINHDHRLSECVKEAAHTSRNSQVRVQLLQDALQIQIKQQKAHGAHQCTEHYASVVNPSERVLCVRSVGQFQLPPARHVQLDRHDDIS